MTELPRLGAALYLADLERVSGLRDWIEGRDVEIRDFTEIGALARDTWRPMAEQLREAFRDHSGRLGLHGPFWGFAVDQADPDFRALVQDRLLTALAAAEVFCSGREGHMVIHSPFTTWASFNRGTEWDDHQGIIDRTLETLAPVVRRAEEVGVTLVIEKCEDRDPWERVTLARAFGNDAVRVSLDTGHAHYAHGSTGGVVVDAHIRAAGAMLAHVHLQDADGIADRHWALGRGTIRWHGVFAALAELPVMPRLILEMAKTGDVLVSAKYLAEQGLAA